MPGGNEQWLTRPVFIGNMAVKNRMVFPPMNTNFSNENGAVTQQMSDYYVRRAKGGAGLIIVEAADVVEYSKNHGVQPMICDEKYVPGWANMVERIKRYGAKVSLEIAHYGSECEIGPKFSASTVSSKKNAVVKALSVDEIIAIEDQFAAAARYARTAGFDAVTLHAAHGYLLGQFLSPAYNLRQDAYGGSTENRLRILLEIIARIKRDANGSFPIMVRLSGDEYLANGMQVDETKKIAVMLEKAGAAAIDISAGTPASSLFCIPPYSLTGYAGMLAPIARAVKAVVSIPVIVACGIRSPELAEKIVESGDADLVAMGRTLLADPDFCLKVINGEENSIRPCLSCEHCLSTIESGRSMRCAVNPEVGREYEFHDIERAAHPKEVFIVGGGLAGMEAARISQLRGHRVTLFEKSDQLGGILNVGKIPPNKEMVGSLIDWYKNELERAGVPIHTGRQVNSEWLAEQEPDVVMVATGSEYLSNLPGADPAKVMHAVEALRNPERVGRKTIIIGGGATGCEVAEHLTRGRVEVFFHRIQDIRGELVYTKSIHEAIEAREITIIEMLPEICTDMDRFNKTLMQIRLKENNVKVLVNSQVHFLPDGSIEAINRLSGKKESLMADTIIIAFGTKPKAQDRIPGIHEVHYIGDASRTGKIIDAIYDGYCIARMI